MSEDSHLKDHLYLLEKQLLQPETRKSAEELNILLADDFKEFGSSGRVFNKEQGIEGLANEQSDNSITLMEFNLKILAPDVALTTYRTLRAKENKYALRSSIWRLKEEKWQMIFHQGTITESP